MKKHIFIIAVVLLGFLSCKNKEGDAVNNQNKSEAEAEKLVKLQWLLGTWINEKENDFSQETWTRENDSSFTGYSFREVSGEVVFAEAMVLQLKNGDLNLTVASPKKPHEKPVTFVMVASEGDKFIFENKSHDFPQKIIYWQPVKDSLHAWIEGVENGNTKKIDFYFSKKR
ncbi:MAG: hypothetical protein CL526_00625 [Aequorivita sp.]|nr:hypothetical protein [Aequorivita sp.]|tara:strand:+ start:68991 stop:69503 length:513 start_codon:yes stop_codon:yes gene_type:complete